MLGLKEGSGIATFCERGDAVARGAERQKPVGSDRRGDSGEPRGRVRKTRSLQRLG